MIQINFFIYNAFMLGHFVRATQDRLLQLGTYIISISTRFFKQQRSSFLYILPCLADILYDFTDIIELA